MYNTEYKRYHVQKFWMIIIKIWTGLTNWIKKCFKIVLELCIIYKLFYGKLMYKFISNHRIDEAILKN